MYVCLCHAVTDHQIKQVVQEGICSLRQVQLCLRLGTNCGKCIPSAREIITAAKAKPQRAQGAVATQRPRLVGGTAR